MIQTGVERVGTPSDGLLRPREGSHFFKSFGDYTLSNRIGLAKADGPGTDEYRYC